MGAAQENRWAEAERFFSEAITAQPTEPLSWVARGTIRGELRKFALAANDLAHVGTLFDMEGNETKAQQLHAASEQLHSDSTTSKPSGTGVGSALLGGTLSMIQNLAPIALRALMPLVP